MPKPKEIRMPKTETWPPPVKRSGIRISDFGLLSDLGFRSSGFVHDFCNRGQAGLGVVNSAPYGDGGHQTGILARRLDSRGPGRESARAVQSVVCAGGIGQSLAENRHCALQTVARHARPRAD